MLDYQRDLHMARRASRVAEGGGVARVVDYRAFTTPDRVVARRVDAFADVALDRIRDRAASESAAAAAKPVVATLFTIDVDRGG